MKEERGVSLIESLLVVVVIGLIVYLLAVIPNAVVLIGKSRRMSLAKEIAVKQIEGKRSLNFANLVNDSSAISDSRISLLPQGNGLVVVEDCDPGICVNGEQAKQVTVKISWQENNKFQEVALETMIGEGGINQ